MNKNLSLSMGIIGLVVAVAAVLIHYLVKTEIFPHITIVLGIIGLILIGVGVWGIVSVRTHA